MDNSDFGEKTTELIEMPENENFTIIFKIIFVHTDKII